jgi:hypothetical protein
VANRAKAGALFFADLGVDKVGAPDVTGSCTAKVAGKTLRVLEKAFTPDGVWVCVWRIPKTGKGTATGKISVSDGTTAFPRQFAVHITPLPKKH